MYLCLIAADMLEYGMTIDAYLAYLDEKGLNYVREEEIVPTTDGELIANYLYFTPRICLTVQGDPITYAEIMMDSPFEIPHITSIAYDLNNTSTPYLVMTDDESLIPETEYSLDETP